MICKNFCYHYTIIAFTTNYQHIQDYQTVRCILMHMRHRRTCISGAPQKQPHVVPITCTNFIACISHKDWVTKQSRNLSTYSGTSCLLHSSIQEHYTDWTLTMTLIAWRDPSKSKMWPHPTDISGFHTQCSWSCLALSSQSYNQRPPLDKLYNGMIVVKNIYVGYLMLPCS